jgi:hypothetical protein
VGFVAAPLALRHLAERQLGERIGRKVTVERVSHALCLR